MIVRVAFSYYFLAGVLFTGSHGNLTCFKRYRRKTDDCGGPIRKKSISDPQTCCTGNGDGFTQQTLNKLGKNKYTCESCDVWKQNNNITVKPPEIQEKKFVCFRKFRERKKQCGGPMVKRHSVATVEECCTGKGGFTNNGLDSVGKNKYTCTSCAEWRQNQSLTTPTTVHTTPVGPEEWTDWSACSVTCGTGRQTRYRHCSTCSQNKLDIQYKPCLVHFYCPETGNWGEWTTWEACSRTCDGGLRRRERLCDDPPPKHGGAHCEGTDRQEETCGTARCPVDGNWGPWSRFSYCSTTCGRGEMTRTRMCNSPAPTSNGQACRGRSVEARRCENRKCPIHGGWSSWGEWSGCSSTCGHGDRVRTRTCDNPRPRFGGRDCAGAGEELERCHHPNHCPVNGGWSEWSDYGRCRADPCQKGHMLRVRDCDSPRPQHRGRMCVGKSVERSPCFNEEGCPVDGGWCEYSFWSSCSSTCFGDVSTQSRVRSCNCPPPSNSGKMCQGESFEVRDCEGFNICDIRVDG